MKFRLSTLILTMTLVAALTGWLSERRDYARKLDEGVEKERAKFESRLVEETEREGAISSCLSMAIFSNLIYFQLDDLSDSEFARKRRIHLVSNVVFLFVHRENAVVRTIVEEDNYKEIKHQKDALMREAARSLELLEVSTPSEFAIRIRDSGFTETDELIDSDGELEPRLAAFVTICLSYGQYQKLYFESNRTAEQSLDMAECVLALCDAGVLEHLDLYRTVAELEGLTNDPDGRTSGLLDQLYAMEQDRYGGYLDRAQLTR